MDVILLAITQERDSVLSTVNLASFAKNARKARHVSVVVYAGVALGACTLRKI
jgi:hypothetical protein